MRTTSPKEHSWFSSCAKKRLEYLRALRYLGTIFVRVTSTFTVLAMAVDTTEPTRQPRGRFVVVGGAGGPQRFCVVGVVARQRTCGRSSAARRSASIVCGLARAQRWRPRSKSQWCGKRSQAMRRQPEAIDGEQNRTKAPQLGASGASKRYARQAI